MILSFVTWNNFMFYNLKRKPVRHDSGENPAESLY